MLSDRDRTRLRHMLDAAEKALRFVKGRTRTDLDNDEMLSLAVVRLLEILGEAARHVTSDLQRSRPDIPWRQIAGTRDRLIHGYDEVDLDIVWTIVSAELRPLVDALAHLLDEGAGPPLQSMAE